MGKSREDSSSKSDRKFEKKLQFYAKVKDKVAGLNAQKSIKKNKLRSRQKKLKAYDLSSLTEFLPEITAPQQPTPFKLNCKSRQKLLLKESKQLSTVLNHPAFQSDPLEAIHQHLQNTQPPADEKPKKKLKNKNGSKKRKMKKKPSASNGPESMDL
ncbi:uncharacterized protein [Euphorbia lathyris]|uniref:uncharacterized protein n=1 Tax=Euphorbia lathyris TaxID=212925 RepID=UPI0033141281